jgi:hypothetical protein
VLVHLHQVLLAGQSEAVPDQGEEHAAETAKLHRRPAGRVDENDPLEGDVDHVDLHCGDGSVPARA